MGALRAAAQVFGRALVIFAARIMGSDETAAAVNVVEISDTEMLVNAGRPAGRWGWTPIEAWMFETGAKHPLYGDRGHWYSQPRRPILDKAAISAEPEASRVYGNTRAAELAVDYGYR